MAIDTTSMMSKNVILIDASYADQVAFNLTVIFERMLERRIPKADLPLWLNCVALDGGIAPGDNDIQVIFIYEKGKDFVNFTPSSFEKELNGMAFKDHIAEFTMEAYSVANDVTCIEEQYVATLDVLLDNDKIENVILVPNMEQYDYSVLKMLKNKKKTNVTLLAMQPVAGSGFNQQILGYSLMCALGIKSDEIR